MNITVIGKGNVGGGLGRLWERAGHDVSAFGKEGGDASNAETQKQLEQAEGRVEILRKRAGGQMVPEPFEPENSETP